MNIIGRITKDAKVKQLKDDRQVVEFSVAVNDYFKKKGAEKGETVATFFNCSYWRNPKGADRLKKGTLVELSGRLSVNAYKDVDGNPKASLNFHVNTFTVHQNSKSVNAISSSVEITEPIEDLPF